MAGNLKRIISAKKNELDVIRSNKGNKSSERLRVRRSQAATSLSASVAAVTKGKKGIMKCLLTCEGTQL